MREDEWPEVGDIVIATVSEIFQHGAFVKLDEYGGKEGLIHISEISSRWVKNIKDYVREGQKIVAQVIRVDPEKGHIDLSLRKVTEARRKQKIQEWKKYQKACKLLEIAANKLGKTFEEGWREAGKVLEREFGGLYDAMEEIVVSGRKSIEKLVGKEWSDAIGEVVEANVEIPYVEIGAYLNLECPTGNGIETIKKALIEARDKHTSEDVSVDIRYAGAPRYRVKVRAPDYKTAEKALQGISKTASRIVAREGGTSSLTRV
ncbi:MAG: translation initiation factor IF-2 subunit alpha [Methanobacteriota archaeon]|nr:MAG: translation initiation factor IF-2 subunit alpha [Euryarchaeota archaeon]